MFRNTFQSGFLSILFSVGTKPLQIWDKKVDPSISSHFYPMCSGSEWTHQADYRQRYPISRSGTFRKQCFVGFSLLRFTQSLSTTYISCPADPRKSLGIKLPFLVLIVKNLKKYFTFEIQVSPSIHSCTENFQILDDVGIKRRFRASNYQSTTRVKPFICTMPLRLDDGWNNVFFNVGDFTKRAYGTNFLEVLRIQIHANCRIRRIYFCDRLYSDEELPAEFKLYLPVQSNRNS
ncbi:uncharacterized protein DEA37_0006706 [Paragonimus westermani]|uniref:CFA20 domain-containing protein n=1 Tax=Paragonimus westermani TaxID=34504 RepID=A0A5J4NGY4_9TREM|nr:uncharacterized protein DEA37_0006706 [Paragonimus westermani]